MNYDYSNPAVFQDIIRKRELYLWGARHDGLGMCRVLERNGIKPTGFIDSSLALKGKTALGYTISLPDEILPAAGKPKPFIIITSIFFKDEIAASCQQAGYEEYADFISFREIQKFDYQVDISVTCNLKCISCPRGNYPVQPTAGFMKAETYARVIDKILKEDPYTGIITLYNWGEPLLNPDLPEIIRITNERHLLSAVSSNLCLKKDLTDFIRSKPTWLRVSVSGVGKNYEMTHTGGKWALFLEKIHQLKELKDQYHPELMVEVFFHIYRHNTKEDFETLTRLCQELDFPLRYRHAALAPLDNVEAIIDGGNLSPEVKKTMELQLLKIKDAMAIAETQRDKECFYKRCLWITWNLTVSQCMEWFNPEFKLTEKDFLSTPLAEIAAARQNNPFCEKCMSKALHRCYLVYADEKLIHQKKSIEINQ
jgi:MoaA/NifB/PqqE/SkfB family radical SAM enzyme